MIVSGGENIYPREVEDVLFQHPAVADAAVIGVPERALGRGGEGVVVLRDGAWRPAPRRSWTSARAELAGYKRPRSVDFVEALPRNAERQGAQARAARAVLGDVAAPRVLGDGPGTTVLPCYSYSRPVSPTPSTALDHLASPDGDAPGTMREVSVVDCDVHPDPSGIEEFAEYVPEPFRSRYYTRHAHETYSGYVFYAPPANGMRLDSITPGGHAPGTDPAFLAKQVLQDAKVDYAILGPLTMGRARHWDADWDVALNAGTNNWLADRWLSAEPNWHGRFRGSIRVSPKDPDAAVEEIERWAGHPFMAQVLVLADGFVSFGQPQFHRVLAAAERHSLPVATHLLRHAGIGSMTPVGFPSYHVETLSQWTLCYVCHVTNLIFEGVFEKFPGLKFVNLEGGAAWIAPLMWRLDKHWEALGAEVPHVKRRPSEYMRESVRFGTQPLEEPRDRKSLERMLEWGAAAETLLFASDYPHYDYDDPSFVRARIPRESRRQVMSANAVALYGLPTARPTDRMDRRDADRTAGLTMRSGAEVAELGLPE